MGLDHHLLLPGGGVLLNRKLVWDSTCSKGLFPLELADPQLDSVLLLLSERLTCSSDKALRHFHAT